jgi:hypothetical protein
LSSTDCVAGGRVAGEAVRQTCGEGLPDGSAFSLGETGQSGGLFASTHGVRKELAQTLQGREQVRDLRPQ